MLGICPSLLWRWGHWRPGPWVLIWLQRWSSTVACLMGWAFTETSYGNSSGKQVEPRGSSSANTTMWSPLFSSLPGMLPPDLRYGALRRKCLVAEPEGSEVPSAVSQAFYWCQGLGTNKMLALKGLSLSFRKWGIKLEIPSKIKWAC